MDRNEVKAINERVSKTNPTITVIRLCGIVRDPHKRGLYWRVKNYHTMPTNNLFKDTFIETLCEKYKVPHLYNIIDGQRITDHEIKILKLWGLL